MEPTASQYKRALIIVWETMAGHLAADAAALGQCREHLEYLKDAELGEEYAMSQVELIKKIPEQYLSLKENALKVEDGSN